MNWGMLQQAIQMGEMKHSRMTATMPKHEPSRVISAEACEGIYPIRQPQQRYSSKSNYYNHANEI